MAQLSNSVINNFRTVAAQSGFTRKLFSQGINGIPTASLITEFRALLKIAGVTLPPEAAVSIDVIQILLAGGAVVNDLSTAVEVFQIVGDVSNVAVGVANLLADLGIGGEPVKQIADFASLGSMVSLAVSSGGANVLADIGAVVAAIAVVCDLKKDFFGDHDAAVADAKRNLADALRGAVDAYLKPQVQFAAAQIKAFQSGQLDYFDFVANIALNSPVEFKSFFPSLACYFPDWQTVTITRTASGSSGGLFGSEDDTESASVHFQQLLATKKQVESVLFNYFIGSPLSAFKGFFNVSQGISLEAISVVAMILSSGSSGAVTITQDFDILAACQILGVTPSVLGDTWLFKGLDKNELETDEWMHVLPYQPLTIPMANFQGSGVVINGHEYLTPAQQSAKDARDALVALQLELQRLDRVGDIDSLMKYPEAVAILKKWATFHPDHVLSTASNPFNDFDASLGPPINPVDPNKDIDISNYWKCLSVIKQMRSSDLFSDESVALSHIGSIDFLTTETRRVQAWVVAKSMNAAARRNIADALGTTPDNIGTRLTKAGTRVFYKKAG